MRFFSLFRHLLLSLIVWQAQAQVNPRGFKFTGPKKGVRGGCSAEDVSIILKELEIAQEAAEATIRHLTNYPYFEAFQSPDHPYFQGKDFTQAARRLYSRIAHIADGFHLDDRFRVECRSDLCTMSDDDTIAVTMESAIRIILPPTLWLLKPGDPVIAFCEPFFKTKDGGSGWDIVSTELRLQQFREDIERSKKNPGTKFRSLNMRNVGNMRSQIILHELAHTAYASKPINAVMKPNAFGQEPITDYAYSALDCFYLARGMWDMATMRRPNTLEGAKRAAMNAESWGLIGMGIYISRELGISKIPIPQVENSEWGPEYDT
ncbi:hypothetical protein CKAH01_00394 [Colletotrichum kahawae]|uniref:Uncharacterized protein n=1 Tax=Colletotrichum kahawae TaxID=34407 RepID=A0AAD9YUU6_COLKA|nr:hypothetical protein CKAH01_00394 [Colletotrichum kahawae]